MKHPLFSLLLLVAAASANARAAAVKTIQVDLDGDSRPDTVAMIDNGKIWHTIEVKLSKTGRSVSFEKIARNYGVEDPSRSECDNTGATDLLAGARSFVISEVSRDMDACASVESDSFRIGMKGEEFVIEQISRNLTFRSSGDPGEISTQITDYSKGRLSLWIAPYKGNGEPEFAREKLPRGCTLTVAAFQESGEPFCAVRAQYYQKREHAIDRDKVAVCPNLQGQFECILNRDGREEKDTFFSIQRVIDDVNNYDISDQSVVLFADGKRKLVNRENGPTYNTVSCNRDWLSFKEEKFLTLSRGDKRKPIFDKLPFRVEQTVWTQLDFYGNAFEVKIFSRYLQDDGHYEKPYVITKSCHKVESN